MRVLLALACTFVSLSSAAAVDVLPGTQPLTWDGDISLKMVDDLHAFADRATAASIDRRARHWNRDFSSAENYAKSIAPNRARLAKYLGFRDPLEQLPQHPTPFIEDASSEGSGPGYQIRHYIQRWPEQLETDGFIWSPMKDGKVNPLAPTLVLIPDADQLPDDPIAELDPAEWDVDQVVRKFVDRGYCVIVPRLINRRHDLSTVADGARKTRQPHREFIYRQAFEMGRHVIGYELAAIRGVLDYFCDPEHGGPAKRFAVAGYGEGGLLALYTAALDPRVAVVGVSGYFGPRERLWEEPIYRNVWGLLDEFGDAELAAMIAPNTILVEACTGPEVRLQNDPADPRHQTPGFLTTPKLDDVRREVERANRLLGSQAPFAERVKLVGNGSGEPWSDAFVDEILAAFGRSTKKIESIEPTEIQISGAGTPDQWHQAAFQSFVDHTQALVRESEYVRKDFWKNADRKSRDPAKWEATLGPYRDHLYDEVLGRFDLPKLPPNAKTRKAYETDKYIGYEVVLDVFGKNAEAVDVWAYGVLLVPKDIQPGERRPVVVCQHGLEGRPDYCIKQGDPGESHYHRFAHVLAERGFVTFSPQNPYIGKDHFRQLVRKLYPLKKTLWSVIVPQHEQITDWLASLDFVDGERIGFYGLSYGGKTAMRVPALVERYCLSICSGDFNEWIRKNTSVRDTFSYMGTHEYEMYEFDLGHTFNYAEMAYLIAPRPFMVERGHRDGVGIDEWVDYEYAKVRLLYADLKISERTEIEHFDGPHTIHGVGTYAFLHRHLNWPAPK